MFCDLLGQAKQVDMTRTSLQASRDLYRNDLCPGLSNEDKDGVRYLTEPRADGRNHHRDGQGRGAQGSMDVDVCGESIHLNRSEAIQLNQ